MTERPLPGWAVYVEDTPASIVLAMPEGLAKGVANYLGALALEAGGAVDRGRVPPGDPMDGTGTRYSLQIDHEPVIIEYTVHRDLRAIRIPVLVWFP